MQNDPGNQELVQKDKPFDKTQNLDQLSDDDLF